eukprot:SAG31_NODE_2360_length_5872_cov_20.790230_5_plen_130_part_00
MAFATSDESTSVGMGAFCLPFPGGPGACAALPTDTGDGHNHHMIQTGFLDTTDPPGGAAAAAAPGSPHSDMYMYSDLLQGSGGEKQIDISPIWGALGHTLAEPFSFLGSLIRCDSALGAAAPSLAPLPR